MGENYYARSEECPLCGKQRREDMHLCKTSIGWRTLWQKTEDIGSVKAIKRYLKVSQDKIVDEYDREYDREEFFELMNSLDKGRSHVEEQHLGYPCYLDEEGYEFSVGRFS